MQLVSTPLNKYQLMIICRRAPPYHLLPHHKNVSKVTSFRKGYHQGKQGKINEILCYIKN